MISTTLNGKHLAAKSSNYNTDYCISPLLKQNDSFEDKGLALFKKIRAMGIQVKVIRSDNDGENNHYRKPLKVKNLTSIFSTQPQEHHSKTARLNKNSQPFKEKFAQLWIWQGWARDFDANYGQSVHLMSPTWKISSFEKQTRNLHTKILQQATLFYVKY